MCFPSTLPDDVPLKLVDDISHSTCSDTVLSAATDRDGRLENKDCSPDH
jgi:hypothetical protein